ncbi:hypothetical protein ACKKBF_B13470 [Auxenochlorella protothecoides x Auxenochlorella symbiontica]
MSDAGAQEPDTASPCEEPGSAGSVADHIQFRIVYGRNSKSVSRSPQHTVRELKREIEEHTGVVVPNQKLLCKTQLRDHQTLSEAGVKQGSKIMVLAIRPQSSPATPQTAEGSTEHAWDPTPAAEVWADQERHKKAGQGGQECRGPCPPPRSSGLDASLFIPRHRRRFWSRVDRRVAGSASQTGRSLWMTISHSSRPSSHRPGSRCG